MRSRPRAGTRPWPAPATDGPHWLPEFLSRASDCRAPWPWRPALLSAVALVATAAGVAGAAAAGAGVAGAGAAGAAGVAGAGTAGAGGVGARLAPGGRSFRSQSAGGASDAIPTSRVSLAKPIISTSMVHVPSANSGNEYAPWSSVVVTIFLSPCVAVTVAPGTGNPPDLTAPWCSAAIRPLTAMPGGHEAPEMFEKEIPSHVVTISGR